MISLLLSDFCLLLDEFDIILPLVVVVVVVAFSISL